MKKGADIICAWNSKTNKCRKKRVTRKRTPDIENCPRLKTSVGCGKNELCKWNSKTSKCRKMRVVVSKTQKRTNKYPIAFLFTIIGGKKEDEDDWKEFPANKLSKAAKETFKLGVVDQLDYFTGIRIDTLKYTFKKEGLVVKTTVGFDYRDDNNSDETEELMDFVAVVNEKTIWQTHFKRGELDVESGGKYYKFWDVSVVA